MRRLVWTWGETGSVLRNVAGPEPVVWSVDLDAPNAPPDFELRNLLDDRELTEMKRLRFSGDRRRYLRAHSATRLILSEYCDVPASTLVFHRNEKGKPYLAMPLAGLSHNLSHSGERMLLAVQYEGSLGVDLEYVEASLDIDAILSHVLSPSEADAVSREHEGQRIPTFLRHWVAKEALLKASGDGLRVPMPTIQLDLRGDRPAVVAVPSGFPTWRQLEIWEENGYVGALAVL